MTGIGTNGFIVSAYPIRKDDSFYSFNEEDSSCVFDEDGYKAAYEEMIGIIKKIVHKLQMINNNDYVIEDYITKDIED